MTPDESPRYHISHGYDVLPPRSGKAYPIPCDEWEHLKSRIRMASASPWGFHTAGSLLLGASLSTLVTLIIGTFSPNSKVYAEAIFATTGSCGILCLIFAHQRNKDRTTQFSDVLNQMNIIEKRFDQGTAKQPAEIDVFTPVAR